MGLAAGVWRTTRDAILIRGRDTAIVYVSDRGDGPGRADLASAVELRRGVGDPWSLCRYLGEHNDDKFCVNGPGSDEGVEPARSRGVATELQGRTRSSCPRRFDLWIRGSDSMGDNVVALDDVRRGSPSLMTNNESVCGRTELSLLPRRARHPTTRTWRAWCRREDSSSLPCAAGAPEVEARPPSPDLPAPGHAPSTVAGAGHKSPRRSGSSSTT